MYNFMTPVRFSGTLLGIHDVNGEPEIKRYVLKQNISKLTWKINAPLCWFGKYTKFSYFMFTKISCKGN